MEHEPFTGQTYEDVLPKAENIGQVAVWPMTRLRLLENLPALPDCSFYEERQRRIAAENPSDLVA